jgi:hypothetical protein
VEEYSLIKAGARVALFLSWLATTLGYGFPFKNFGNSFPIPHRLFNLPWMMEVCCQA